MATLDFWPWVELARLCAHKQTNISFWDACLRPLSSCGQPKITRIDTSSPLTESHNNWAGQSALRGRSSASCDRMCEDQSHTQTQQPLTSPQLFSIGLSHSVYL